MTQRIDDMQLGKYYDPEEKKVMKVPKCRLCGSNKLKNGVWDEFWKWFTFKIRREN